MDPSFRTAASLLLALAVAAAVPMSSADHENDPEEEFHLNPGQGTINEIDVPGMRHYYVIALGTGQSGLGHPAMDVILDQHGNIGPGDLMLFIGYEEKPDPRACDSPTCIAVDGEDEHCILLPREGTYYALVYPGPTVSASLPYGFETRVGATTIASAPYGGGECQPMGLLP